MKLNSLKAENAIKFKIIVSVLLRFGMKRNIWGMLTCQMAFQLPGYSFNSQALKSSYQAHVKGIPANSMLNRKIT